MKLINPILNEVVIPRHIYALNNVGPAAGGHRNRTRRVQQMAIGLHGCRHPPAFFRPLNPPLLVAHAPQDNAGMVAVPFHHAPEQPPMFCIDPRKAVFLQHKDAQAVAGVQQFRRSRIVAGADGIYAQFLKLFEPIHLQRVRNGAAHPGMVLVLVYAPDFHALAIEENPSSAVKQMSLKPVRVQ